MLVRIPSADFWLGKILTADFNDPVRLAPFPTR